MGSTKPDIQMLTKLNMKPIVIRVIKRKALADIAQLIPTKSPRKHRTTVTGTINNWIAESRRNRIGSDRAARTKIAGWKAEAQT